MTGLLSYSEVEKISFIDLVHAHQVIDFKEENQSGMLQMIGEKLGWLK